MVVPRLWWQLAVVLAAHSICGSMCGEVELLNGEDVTQPAHSGGCSWRGWLVLTL